MKGETNTAERCIAAYFKFETRRGFYEDGPCEDPKWIRCKHCCQFFSTISERSEHLQCDCPNKPPSLSGTKGWRIVKRKKAASLLTSSKQPVVILDAPGGLAGGTPVETEHQGLVLGCVVCGEGGRRWPAWSLPTGGRGLQTAERR